MKIRMKFAVMVGIPLLGILIIFIIGFISFFQIRTTVARVNTLQNDRATMIDADRDAYQAYLSEFLSAQSLDEEEVQKQKESHDENMKQTWERMSGPSINFTKEMETEFEIFEESYEEWKTHSYEIINLSA